MRGHIEEVALGTAERGLQTWQARLQDIADKTVASTSEEIRARVTASAQATADQTLRDWQAKLHEIADQTAASSSEQIQRQINETLNTMAEPEELRDQAVNDALEALRGRLSQFLGLLQGGGSK